MTGRIIASKPWLALASLLIVAALLGGVACEEEESPPSSASGETAACVTSNDASRLIGESACVRVLSVEASYRSDVGGQPTFCNDAPYPAHSFTALIWGDNRGNWSTPPEQLYDGACLNVCGLVTSYRGTPQIELAGPSQASFCQ